MDSISQIKKWIAQGETEKAVEALLEYARSKGGDAERQALLLSGQFRQWKREQTLGIQQSNNELRRIELSIMELLDDNFTSTAQTYTPAAPQQVQPTSNRLTSVLLGVFALVAIVFAVLYFSNAFSGNAQENPMQQNEPTAANEEEGTAVGNETETGDVAPETPAEPPFKYKTVVLTGKTWMAEDLNEVTPNSICWGDDDYNCQTHGRLYTFAAAKQACANLGDGWRLPTNADWKELTRAFGGAMGDLSSNGKEAYRQMIKNGTTGFDADFGGKRIYFPENQNYTFYDLNTIGHYWVDEEVRDRPDNARVYVFRSQDNTLLYQDMAKRDYISCRCVKD